VQSAAVAPDDDPPPGLPDQLGLRLNASRNEPMEFQAPLLGQPVPVRLSHGLMLARAARDVQPSGCRAESASAPANPDQPYNMWLFGLDASGTLLWQKTVVDPQPGTVHGLLPTRDGAFLAVSGGCCGSHVVKLRLDGSFDGECDGLTPTLGRLMRVPTAPIPATLVPDRTSFPAASDVPVVADVNASTSERTCH
jgi:hypothetical protein